MNHSIPDEDESFSDFTDQQQDAIQQALLKAHLKPEAEWPRILFDITTLLCELHPNPVVRAGEIRDHLKALLAHLEAAAQVYDQMSDLEQAHVEDQRMISARGAEGESQQHRDWAACVFEQTGIQITIPECQPRDLADHHRPYALGRSLDHLLAAVLQAQARPINPMMASVQTEGRTKNLAIRRAVWTLLEIFERATGVRPTVQSDDYIEGYAGTFYPFAVACLAPVGLVARTSLGSGKFQDSCRVCLSS